MIGIVYLGNNPKTQERLKYIPGTLFNLHPHTRMQRLYALPVILNEHFILFYERSVRNEDITAITYLRKKFGNVYIILLTGPLKTWIV